MKEIIHFTDLTVEIWRRPRQRHMNLTVRADGRVRVTCNKRVAKRHVLEFVTDSREFIAKRSLEREAVRKRFPAKRLLSDEMWMFLGKRLPLQIVWTWKDRIQVTVLEGSTLEMSVPLATTRDERFQAMRQFYRRQARLHLPERLSILSAKMGVKARSLAIRGQRTRWGSCSSKGQINLNWKLMAAPVEVIDYVIIHELAHLVHMNHSRHFWDLVAQHCPEYKTALKWLKEHEPELGEQFRV